MNSAYLPEDFDISKPVVVIAGRGEYPWLMVEGMRAAGVKVRLIGWEDETEDSLWNSFAENERVMLKVGQISKMLKALKSFGAGYAVMVGQIRPRRLFGGLHLDLKTAYKFARLKTRNAETIFGAVAGEIEGVGVSVLDARAFMDAHVAGVGVLSGGRLKLDEGYIRHGVMLAKEMARLDVGQGVVVRKGTVLAVEAFEGTDAMLERAGSFGAKGALFVKTAKEGQDYRFDVPCFGMRTVDRMVSSGIKYAGLEAGSTLILDKEKVLKEAHKRGLVVFGYEGADYGA